MTANGASLAQHELRGEPRDEVHYRARGSSITCGDALPMVIVNMSPGGLMARCETPIAAGDRFRVALPVLGTLVAEVRWSLGGRIGCKFDEAVGLRDYGAALAGMR